MTFPTKLLHNVNNTILKYLCEFQVDISINAKVITVQNLEDLCTFILRQPYWSAKECPQPIFLYNATENSPTFLAHNSVFIDPDNFKFGTETRYVFLLAISEFGAI